MWQSFLPSCMLYEPTNCKMNYLSKYEILFLSHISYSVGEKYLGMALFFTMMSCSNCYRTYNFKWILDKWLTSSNTIFLYLIHETLRDNFPLFLTTPNGYNSLSTHKMACLENELAFRILTLSLYYCIIFWKKKQKNKDNILKINSLWNIKISSYFTLEHTI